MVVVLAYILIVLIWTTTPLAIVWSGESDWFFGVAARTALGAVAILPILFWWQYRKQRNFPFDLKSLQLYGIAALPIFGGMTLMYWAGNHLPSGWISILFALTPIMTGILAHFLLTGNQLTLRKLVAISISLFGLWILFSPNLSQQMLGAQLLAITAALFSVFFHSLGTVLMKRCAHSLPALQVAVGALWVTVILHFIMQPAALFNWPALSVRESSAILYAALVGSVLGFVLYFYLIRQVDAMKVALIPVITPVCAILLGHYLNDEPLSVTIGAGTVIVISGLILFEWRLKRKATTNPL